MAPQQPAAGDDVQLNAEAIQHPRGGGVDARVERVLHAAGQQQHAPGVAGGRPWPGRAGRRNQGFQAGRQQRARQSAQSQQGRKTAGVRQNLAQAPAHQALPGAARQRLLGQLAAVVQHAAVLHAGRAGGLAGAAGQAAVKVRAQGRRHHAGLDGVLDLVDAPARAVELVAANLKRRAGDVAEAAVHALAHDALDGGALGGGAHAVRKSRLHGVPGSLAPRSRRRCATAADHSRSAPAGVSRRRRDQRQRRHDRAAATGAGTKLRHRPAARRSAGQRGRAPSAGLPAAACAAGVTVGAAPVAGRHRLRHAAGQRTRQPSGTRKPASSLRPAPAGSAPGRAAPPRRASPAPPAPRAGCGCGHPRWRCRQSAGTRRSRPATGAAGRSLARSR